MGNWHIRRWAMFYGSDDDEDAKTQKGVLRAQFPESEVESLDIDIKYGEVRFCDSDSDQITINIDAPKRNVYECENDNGTLELEDNTSKGWRNFNDNKVKVTIAIPQGKVFERAKLVTNAGAVRIGHALCAREIDLELEAGELEADIISAQEDFSASVGAGRMVAKRFAAGSLDVDCGMGEVEFYGSVGREAEVKCGMGRIFLELDAKEADYDYEVSCGLGSVDINGRNFSSLSTEQEIYNNAGRTIVLDCGLGEIAFVSKED